MIFQLLLNIIVFFLKCATWVIIALVAIPYGVLMLLHTMFPVFTNDASFWFWSVFGIITIVAYIVLWKPILWLIGIFQLMGGAGE